MSLELLSERFFLQMMNDNNIGTFGNQSESILFSEL